MINLFLDFDEGFIYLRYFFQSRHKLAKLYLEKGTLVWNGNHTEGKEKIQKFYEELPVSDHTITTLDTQPINGKRFLFKPRLSYILFTNDLIQFNVSEMQ